MILKMRDTSTTRPDAWLTISDVISYHQSTVQYRCPKGCGFNESCEECLPAPAVDLCLVSTGSLKQCEQETGMPYQHECLQLFVRTKECKDGQHILVGFADTFVMNDDGKTIDRF